MLIKFKGRRRVFPKIVPCSNNSLSHDDAFILITENEVYVYLPELANLVEKVTLKIYKSCRDNLFLG